MKTLYESILDDNIGDDSVYVLDDKWNELRKMIINEK